MKQAYLVHGWDGSPTNCWFPWIIKELEKLGYKVKALKMPHPVTPTIKDWVATLEKEIKPSQETILIGHSIGCQTIMRYLEKPQRKVQAVFFVAGWFHLDSIDEESGESQEIARPWLEKNIDFKKIKENCKSFTALFSDDDSFVPLSDAKLFEKNLAAKTIIEHNKAHYDIQMTNPALLEEIKKL
ncbi:hypothetical protein EXS74_02980 [Candidatus Woesearchaeota archaeon]|nr:hypothetical protein [Candidatus Woesearchaeota archaeon]